jgi:hypothetical protein
VVDKEALGQAFLWNLEWIKRHCDRVSSGICGGQRGTGTGFCLEFVVDKQALGEVFLRNLIWTKRHWDRVFLQVPRLYPVNIITPLLHVQ